MHETDALLASASCMMVEERTGKSQRFAGRVSLIITVANCSLSV